MLVTYDGDDDDDAMDDGDDEDDGSIADDWSNDLNDDGMWCRSIGYMPNRNNVHLDRHKAN